VIRGWVALALATVTLVGVQIAIVSPLRVSGVVVMVVWLWPLALGLTARPAVAVGGGLLAGLLFDSFTATPYGLSAVVGALLAWAISALAREGVGDLDASAWWVPAGLLALGGLVAPVLYVVIGTLTGHTGYWRASLVAMMVLNAVVFAVLARPVARFAQRIAESGGWVRG
jgi:cell shape-determining protein MreD